MTHYELEIDYEWREISTQTTKAIYSDLNAALERIKQAKKEGKYEGYRLYKLSKELLSRQ